MHRTLYKCLFELSILSSAGMMHFEQIDFLSILIFHINNQVLACICSRTCLTLLEKIERNFLLWLKGMGRTKKVSNKYYLCLVFVFVFLVSLHCKLSIRLQITWLLNRQVGWAIALPKSLSPTSYKISPHNIMVVLTQDRLDEFYALSFSTFLFY